MMNSVPYLYFLFSAVWLLILALFSDFLHKAGKMASVSHKPTLYFYPTKEARTLSFSMLILGLREQADWYHSILTAIPPLTDMEGNRGLRLSCPCAWSRDGQDQSTQATWTRSSIGKWDSLS